MSSMKLKVGDVVKIKDNTEMKNKWANFPFTVGMIGEVRLLQEEENTYFVAIETNIKKMPVMWLNLIDDCLTLVDKKLGNLTWIEP